MSFDRVVVLHGYGASPEDHWFGWLRDTLAAVRITVDVPRLPRSDSPDRAEWIRTAGGAIGPLSPTTVVVGHSLGSITALHAISAAEPARLGAYVSVAGFFEPLPGFDLLNPFVMTPPNFERLRHVIARRVVFASDNDPIVPPELSWRLADQLDAERIELPGAGHVMGSDGYTQLVPLATWLTTA